MADDYAAHIYTPGNVEVGGSTTGTLETTWDIDWIGVNLEAGHLYRLTQTYSEPRITGVYDAAGERVFYGDTHSDERGMARVDVLAQQTGRYFVAIEGAGTGTGSYTVAARELGLLIGTNADDVLAWRPGVVDATGAGYGTGAPPWEVQGGLGRDLLDLSAASVAVDIDLAKGTAESAAFRGFGDNLIRSPNASRSLSLASIEGAIGSDHDDSFSGSDGQDAFRGGAGNDFFLGSDGGRDSYDGGAGIDTLSYDTRQDFLGLDSGMLAVSGQEVQTAGVDVSLLAGAGWSGDAERDVITDIENLTGTAHADRLTGDRGANLLTGLGGDDTLIGLAGDDSLIGGSGTDTAWFGYDRAEYEVTEGTGTWTVAYVGPGAGDGTDTLTGIERLRFADQIVELYARAAPRPAAPGDDYRVDVATMGGLALGAGATGEIEVAGDQDWFAMHALEPGRYSVEMRPASGGDYPEAFPRIHAVLDESGAELAGRFGWSWSSSMTVDTLGFEVPQGGAGRLFAEIGYPDGSLSHELGRYQLTLVRLPDPLTGTPGNDWLTWDSAAVVYGEPGDRRIEVVGGSGTDTLSFADLIESGSSGRGISVDLQADYLSVPGFGFIEFDSIENVTGSRFADTFTGSSAGEMLRGLGGDDTFRAGRGYEGVFDGGPDVLDGGSGRDTVDYFGSGLAVDASLFAGRGWTGAAAEDRFVFIENLTGTRFGDRLTGEHGVNVLRGAAGDDTLMGLAGSDYLDGGDGTDVALFGYERANYEVGEIGYDVQVRYIGPGAGDGTDRLVDIEILRFADGDMVL